MVVEFRLDSIASAAPDALAIGAKNSGYSDYMVDIL